MKALSPIDMNKSELRQAVVEVRTSDPSSPVPGQFWYRSDQNALKIRLSDGTTIMIGASIDDGTVTGRSLLTMGA